MCAITQVVHDPIMCAITERVHDPIVCAVTEVAHDRVGLFTNVLHNPITLLPRWSMILLCDYRDGTCTRIQHWGTPVICNTRHARTTAPRRAKWSSANRITLLSHISCKAIGTV